MVDPGLGRMDPLGQGIEVEAVGTGDHDLPVEHALVGEIALEWVDELGEVPGERLLVPAAQLDLVTLAEDDATESVPLRFVEHAFGPGELPGELGQHRRHGWPYGKGHLADRTQKPR